VEEKSRLAEGAALPHFLCTSYGIALVAIFGYLAHRWSETALNELRQWILLDRRLYFMQSIGIAEA
jgi:hypothetical protein